MALDGNGEQGAWPSRMGDSLLWTEWQQSIGLANGCEDDYLKKKLGRVNTIVF